MSGLRFCMVTTFYPPHHFGGDAVYVRALARELASRGHEVDIVNCTDSYRLHAPEPEPVEDIGGDWCVLEGIPSALLSYPVDVLCPGEVVKHNAHRAKGRTLTWEFNLKELQKRQDRDWIIEFTCRGEG